MRPAGFTSNFLWDGQHRGEVLSQPFVRNTQINRLNHHNRTISPMGSTEFHNGKHTFSGEQLSHCNLCLAELCECSGTLGQGRPRPPKSAGASVKQTLTLPLLVTN